MNRFLKQFILNEIQNLNIQTFEKDEPMPTGLNFDDFHNTGYDEKHKKSLKNRIKY